MANIRDVAKYAQVSAATVSRVINKKGYVNKETEKRVCEALDALQYSSSEIASRNGITASSTIALILPDLTNPFFHEMARGIEDVAKKHGVIVIFFNSDDLGYKEKSYLDILTNKYMHGIIVASNSLTQEDVGRINDKDIPLVVLDRALAQDSCTTIRSNNFEGAKMAVQHLLDIGCKRIAHVYGPQEFITARERLRGYEDSVKEFPWYSPSLLIQGDFRFEGGREAVKTLLGRHKDVDGIFVGNDLMAAGALKGLLQMGIKVPGNIAICGFDGIQLTETTEPEITTVAQPIYEMGKLASKILIEKMQGISSENKVHQLSVTLIERKSTQRTTRLLQKG
jgi:LacI family transcriptional regulator